MTLYQPDDNDSAKILMDLKDLEKIINELKAALNPQVPFTYDLLEMSRIASDLTNWRIRAALDMLQEYEHPF